MSEETTTEEIVEDATETNELPDLPKLGAGKRWLSVELTLQEVDERSKKRITIEEDIELLKSERNAIASEIKHKTDEHDKMREIIKYNREYKDVPCITYADYDRGEAFTIRTDTGKEVDRRPLTPGEKQQKLDLDTEQEHAEAEAAEGEVSAEDPDLFPTDVESEAESE